MFLFENIRFALFDLEFIHAIVGCIRGCISVLSLFIIPVSDLHNVIIAYLISYYWWQRAMVRVQICPENSINVHSHIDIVLLVI